MFIPILTDALIINVNSINLRQRQNAFSHPLLIGTSNDPLINMDGDEYSSQTCDKLPIVRIHILKKKQARTIWDIYVNEFH